MRDVVLEFFRGENLTVVTSDDGFMRITMPSERGPVSCALRADEGTGVVVFYSLCPIEVPAERMSAALELVARLNAGHVLGNLELDVDTGAIRFKTSIDVEGEALNEGLFANLVYANVASLEQMLPAITAVVIEQKSPRDAMRATAA